MRGHAEHHLGRRSRQDDRHLIAKANALRHRDCRLDRRLKPRRVDIGCLHAGRVIDHGDNASGLQQLPGEIRIGDRKCQQCQQQKLDQEGNEMSKVLPDRTRWFLVVDLLPE